MNDTIALFILAVGVVMTIGVAVTFALLIRHVDRDAKHRYQEQPAIIGQGNRWAMAEICDKVRPWRLVRTSFLFIPLWRPATSLECVLARGYAAELRRDHPELNAPVDGVEG